MNVGCGHEFILIGIRADESPPEPFGQIVAVELNLDCELSPSAAVSNRTSGLLWRSSHSRTSP
jgi:hypothetical protein